MLLAKGVLNINQKFNPTNLLINQIVESSRESGLDQDQVPAPIHPGRIHLVQTIPREILRNQLKLEAGAQVDVPLNLTPKSLKALLDRLKSPAFQVILITLMKVKIQ